MRSFSFLALLLFAIASFVSSADQISARQAVTVGREFLAEERTRLEAIGLQAPSAYLFKDYATYPYIAKILPVEDHAGSTVAYVLKLRPQGFVVVSSDTDQTPIIAFSFEHSIANSDLDSSLLCVVKYDLQLRSELFKKDLSAKTFVNQNKRMWRKYLSANRAQEKLTKVDQWPSGQDGWLTTAWNQSGHFREECPFQAANVSNPRCAVGCVATAMAQIVNYWQYPTRVRFSSTTDAYTSSGQIIANGRKLPLTISIFDDASDFGFPTASELNSALSSLNYDGNSSEEAFLSFGAGVKLRMGYGTSSGAFTSDVADALSRGFSYGSAVAGEWPDDTDNLIRNMKLGWPGQISIRTSGQSGGHSVVVDGYRSDGFYHVNFGWGGASTSWYALPDFRSTGYNIVQTVVYDIAPYLAWNNNRADERNSFSTIYGAPHENKVKWRVSANGSFNGGFVVGSGGKVFAAFMSNSGANPFVYVISKFGDLEDTIEVDSGAEIQSIVQTKNEDIFVACDNGELYRVDIDAGQAQLCDSVPGGSQIIGMKVDSTGYLYVVTSGVPAKLYRFNPYGATGEWVYTPPNNDLYLGVADFPAPAIDETRGAVYFAQAYRGTHQLVAVNRANGSTINTRTFTNPSGSWFIRGPAVDLNGKIYFVSAGVLYVIDPDDITGTPIGTFGDGDTAGTGFVVDWPALSRDGRVYIPYLRQVSNTWYYYLKALTFGVGAPTTHWTAPLIATADPDAIELYQCYAGNNRVVCYTVKYDDGTPPDEYQVFGLEDQEDSYAPLWNYSAGTSADNFGFGPGLTVYFTGLQVASNTIYALGEGAEGDPYGAGANYENNQKPSTPSDGNATSTAKSLFVDVTLSWQAQDPDPDQSLKYDIYLGDPGVALGPDSLGGELLPIATGVNAQSYLVHNLRYSTTYLWCVVASDGQTFSRGPTWSFTTPPHPADADGDGVIDDFELLDYIDSWSNGQVGDFDLLDAIDLWTS